MSFDQLPTPQTETSETRLPRSQGDWNKTTERQAILAATGLSRCWRKDDAHDPEMFGLAVAAVFTLYSPDVVQFVCDPRHGLPKTHKWPPTIAEVHEALQGRIADLARVNRYKNWGNNNDDDRERRKDQGLLPPPPREERPTLEQIKAKHGEGWGLGGPEPTQTQLREYIRTLPPGTKATMKELVEGWRASKGLTADSPAPPEQAGPRVMTKAEFIAHPALGETLRCFARTLPDVGQWTMAELCAKWRESEGGEERIDPEAERVRGPATPLVDANGDTFDGGADF